MRATVLHFEIPVGDLGRAADFYRRALGFRVEALAWPGAPYARLRPAGGEGIPGGLSVPEVLGADHPLVVFHVEGGSLEEMLAAITAAGGAVDLEPREVGALGRFARFRDPEGNLLGLWQASAAGSP